MIEKRNFYIDGAWVAPVQARDFQVINPSDETPCGVISLGDKADTDKAVAAARAAFPVWSTTSLDTRISYVEKIFEIYKRGAEDMAQTISIEMGAPIKLARNQQVHAGSWHIEGFLKAAQDFEFIRPLGDHAPGERILYEPIGVIAQITPWNWPMNQIILKAIPAMIAGCTMVLKPSEIAPLSGLLFAEFVDQAGLPPGVFNLVNGDGLGVGTQLSSHPDVDMVSFTGSSRAGKAISKSAADTLKRVSLELGGKGANIIFADAREKAVKEGVIRCFRNTGQSCNAPTRMMVERSRYDEAVAQACEMAEATAVGPASEDGNHIGPAVSEMQFNKIQDLIQVGIDEGARLVCGGTGRPQELNRGYYVRPTVFADVTSEMRIFKEEIFGPVLSILPFDSEEEAIALANDTEFGLTNYIQTQDREKGRRVARAIRSGMVDMNGVGFGQGSPFGGYKQSGNGREGGRFGIEDCLEIKAVSDWE